MKWERTQHHAPHIEKMSLNANNIISYYLYCFQNGIRHQIGLIFEQFCLIYQKKIMSTIDKNKWQFTRYS